MITTNHTQLHNTDTFVLDVYIGFNNSNKRLVVKQRGNNEQDAKLRLEKTND